MNVLPLPAELMEALAPFLEQHLGLAFPANRWRDLARGLHSAAQELGFAEVTELVQYLLSQPVSPAILGVLASQLTIGETYFFREKGTFAVLANHILPPLVAARRATERRLRLWSAGCASGEEAYSLAILLHQTIPDWQNWQILVLATDINPQALAKARQGIYSAWSFRGMSPEILSTYFTPLPDKRWEIKPVIKEMVTFAKLNLASDPFPAANNQTSEMDIIFCRNVLMYLTPKVAAAIVAKFAAALRDGGWLLVSPAECSLVQESCLQACPQANAIPFQKRGLAEPAAPFQSKPDGVQRGAVSGLGDSYRHPFVPCPTTPSQTWKQPDPRQHRSAVGQASPSLGSPAHVQNAGGRGQAPVPEPGPGSPTGQARVTECLEETWTGESPDAAALADLARYYANLGQLEEAQTWAAKAIRQDSLNPHYYYLQASILLELQRNDEAERLLRQALYLQPDFVLAHFLLGRLALEDNRPQEALRHFTNALSVMEGYTADDTIPAAEGLTIGALRQVIQGIKERLSGPDGQKRQPSQSRRENFV